MKQKSLIIITILMSILGFEASAQKNDVAAPEEVFKAFAEAYFNHDLKKMQQYSLYNEDLKILLDMRQLKGVALQDAVRQLKELPVNWYEVGDLMKVHGAEISVNEQMVNKSKKVGYLRHIEFVFPLALRQQRSTKQWKVDPVFMIKSVDKIVRLRRKMDMKDFRIILDGQTIHLNESEEYKFTDKDGKEHVVYLHRNEIQNYKDGRIRFNYHKDMDVYPNKMRDGFVYTLTSELGAEVHILVYNKGVKLKEARQHYIDMWIENYEIKEATFEKQKLREALQEINGVEHKGNIMFARVDGKAFCNQFYFFVQQDQVIGLFSKSKNLDAPQLNLYLKTVSNDLHLIERKK